MREEIAAFLDFHVESTGRWWGYSRKDGIRFEEEIEVVALNQMEKKIAFIECKFSILNYKNALKVISDLKRKAKIVKWHDTQRKEVFGIAAKKIEGKEKLREEGFMAMDFEDLEIVLK